MSDDAVDAEVDVMVGDEHVQEDGTVRYFEGKPTGADGFADASLRITTDNSATIVQFDFEAAMELLQMIENSGGPPEPLSARDAEAARSEVQDDE